MRFFPVKTAVLCLILTPVLYIATLTGCQHALEKQYLNKVQNIFIGDTDPVLSGSVRIQDQIARNIQAFLQKDFMVSRLGLDLDIQVTAADGKIVYPTYVGTGLFSEDTSFQPDSQAIAHDNYALLNAGLDVTLSLQIGHGSLFANLVLGLYFLALLVTLSILYKIGNRRAEQDRKAQQALIDSLKQDEINHEKLVKDLSREREDLFESIRMLNEKYQTDTQKAKVNEDEMFKEILTLEEQLNTFIDLKKNRDQEIFELKSTLEKYERRKGGKNRRNEFDYLSKRFAVLYKTIDMNRKAINGFISLTEDQQIKAEETIHQLDRDPAMVTVKRKVFSGKKHKSSCFEVFFAYNGRLYFQRHPDRIEVVVVGTKNTQKKDMEFLQSL